MYRISELGAEVGLSRTTLLYYEKLGLIKGKRQSNRYRSYTKWDVQRVRLIQQFQACGLTLLECKSCLDASIEQHVLKSRLHKLDDEIAIKQKSRRLLATLLGECDSKLSPSAHIDWLMKQGFNEKEALRLKWLSKDMNKHEQYMADFFRIFKGLERWGPGSDANTKKALSKIPISPKNILDVGCGKGNASTVLANSCSANITAVDNDQPSIDELSKKLAKAKLDSRVKALCASMTDLPFEKASFDLIWAECSAYVMGVDNALKEWQSLLSSDGVLVLSDLVWLSDKPTDAIKNFWQKEYPDMTTVEVRREQAIAAGYQIIDSFTISKESWDGYYEPLQANVDKLKSEMKGSDALQDIELEMRMYREGIGEFGYQMFILKLSS